MPSAKILKCTCGTYTLSEKCPACGLETGNPNPPRFSPKDKYAAQRRKTLYLSSS